MKKIYIAGCGGMLGEGFYSIFSTDYELKCTDKSPTENWLSYLDFRDFNAYKKDVEEFAPDFLFHLGAYTDLEYCEKNIDDTYVTNTLSVENAVIIANSLNIPILYISTAGIFDGESKQYDDWSTPNPLGVYARSKYMGERYVIENAKKYFVCRAGWMMGGGLEKDKKFIGKLIGQLRAGKKELFIVNDKDGTPTYTHDFARTVKELITTEFYGLYNLVCTGNTTRIEVAKKLLEILDRSDVTITEVKSDYFISEYFALRPSSENLINSKLNLRGLNKMTDWETALNEYIKLNFNKNL